MRRFAGPSALAELGPLAGFLEPGFTTLLDPCVAGQKPTPLQLLAKLGIDLGQRPGYPVPDRAGLAPDSPALHVDPNVHGALVAAHAQGLQRGRLVQGTREVLLKRTPVDLELAVARRDDHARDRALALAGSEVARVAGKLGWRARGPGGLLLRRLGGRLRLQPRLLLGLGLQARPLLGAQLAVGLQRDRIQLGS